MNNGTNPSPVWLCIMLDQSEAYCCSSQDATAALCFRPDALRRLVWKSQRADRHAATFEKLFPNDYLEWGTFDVDCVAVDWAEIAALPGFSHHNGRGVLAGELPGREPLAGYAKATRRSDHDALYLNFTDADDNTDWTSCCTENLLRWVTEVTGASRVKTYPALPQETLNRLATLYQYAEGDPAAG